MADALRFWGVDGSPVDARSRPVGKNYVIVPEDGSQPELDQVEIVLEPEPYEQVVFTNAIDFGPIGVHAGLVVSLREARDLGFVGSIPWGLELYGVGPLSIWIWNPNPPAKKPTISRKKIRTAWYDEFVATMRGRL